MRASLAITATILISLSLLTGCWNSRELNAMAIVVGIGIDEVPASDQYRVTFQIMNPATLASKTTGGGGKSVMPDLVLTAVDHTLFSAFRKASQKISRRLFFAHSQLLVIGEPLAKKGINDLFDFYERSHELRLTSSVVIARGTDAESILRVLTPLDTTSATSIKGRLKETAKAWAQSADEDISDVITGLQGAGEPMISGVRIVGSPLEGRKKSNLEESRPLTFIEAKGIALFANGKLTSWLDGNVARGAVWALDKMKSTVINIDCGDKKQAMSITVDRSSTKVRTLMRKGKPVLSLKVKEEGSLSEVDCPFDPNNRDRIVKLQRRWADETKREILSAVKASQKKKSDVFGFSTEMERTHPKAWRKMEDDWPAIYSDSQVEIRVEAYIRRTGLRMKSYLESEKSRR